MPADHAAFVERFQTIGADPQEHLDVFLDFLSPEVRLTAPIVGTTVGRADGYRAFRDSFKELPDLRGRRQGRPPRARKSEALDQALPHAL